MTALLDELNALGVTVADPADAVPILRALMPERVDLIRKCERDSAMPAYEFLWFDLETTGLNPREGLILEFAAVLCEDARGDDFAEVAAYTGAIHYTPDVLAVALIDERVREMHTRNDLWRDVAASTTTIGEVDAFLVALADGLTGGKKHAITLAGNSVHFDLAWARVFLPLFAEYLSHRVFDVSTLTRAVRSWGPEGVVWPKAEAHRALADVRESIALAREARRAMGWSC